MAAALQKTGDEQMVQAGAVIFETSGDTSWVFEEISHKIGQAAVMLKAQQMRTKTGQQEQEVLQTAAETAVLHLSAEMGLKSDKAKAALQAYKDALAKSTDDVNAQRVLLQKIAIASLGESKLDGALQAAQDAVKLSKGADQAAAKLLLARVHLARDSAAEALAVATEAQQLYDKANDKAGVAASLLTAISAHLAKEQIDKAESLASEVLALNPLDKQAEGFALHARALIHLQKGNRTEAARVASQAALCFEGVGHKKGEAIVRYTVLSAHLANRDDGQAYAAAQELVSVCQAANAKIDGAVALQAIAELCITQGRPAGALSAVKQALRFVDAVALPSCRLSLLQTHINVSMMMGGDHNYSEALRAAEEALRIVKEGGLKGEAGWLLAAAQAHLQKSDSMPALRKSQQAVAMFKTSGDKRGEAAATNTLAAAHLSQRVDLDEALAQAKLAEGMFKSLGDLQGQGTALSTIANVHLLRKDLVESISCAKQSENFFEQAGSTKEQRMASQTVSTIEADSQPPPQSQSHAFERSKFGWKKDPHQGLHYSLLFEPQDPAMRKVSGLVPNMTIADGIRSSVVPVVHSLRNPSMHEAPGKQGWCVHVIGADFDMEYGKTLMTSLHTLTTMITAKMKNLTYVQLGSKTRKTGGGEKDMSIQPLAMSPCTLAMLRTARIEAPNMNIGFIEWDTASWHGDRKGMLDQLPSLHDDWDCEVYYNSGTPMYPKLQRRPMEGIIESYAKTGVAEMRKATAKVK